MLSEIRLNWAGVELVLNNLRSIYEPKEQVLIIADLHLGKTAHFRKHGIGIPKQVAENDLKNLSKLLTYYQPKRLIIAGDFFHAKLNSEMALFNQMRASFDSVEFILVRGNHDRLNSKIYADLNIQVVQDLMLHDCIQIVHESVSGNKIPQLSGHLHPGVCLKGKGRQQLRLPAFVYTADELILPAFSHFTGLFTKFDSNLYNFIGVTHQALIQL